MRRLLRRAFNFAALLSAVLVVVSFLNMTAGFLAMRRLNLGPYNVYMDGGSTPLDLTKTVDLGSISGSATKMFTLQLNDVNNNPMPSGSKVEITSMLNGNAAPVMPGTVPSVAPHSTGNVDDPTGTPVGIGKSAAFTVVNPYGAN